MPRLLQPALLASLTLAAACEDRSRPWSTGEGPPAALAPPSPGAATSTRASNDLPAPSPSEAPHTTSDPTAATAPAATAPAAPPEPPELVPGRPITPGAGWVTCSQGLTLSGDPLKDVTRLALVCGPSNGMRRKTRQPIVGVIADKDPPVVTPLKVARSACYRVFAVASEGVAELDVTVRSSRDVAVAADHATGRVAILQADRPFCTFADEPFSLEVAAKRGSGRFAAEVWSIGEPRRKGEALEGPPDEPPMEKP